MCSLSSTAASASPPKATFTASKSGERKGGESKDSESKSDEEESWVDKVNPYYSIVLDDNLEPEVDDKITQLWVTGALCGALCGPLWIPMLWVGENPGAEYFYKEALILIAAEFLTYLVGGVTTPAVGLGAVLITANLVYLAPIGIINGYDRALKKKRGKPYPGSEPADDDDKDAKSASVMPRRSVAMAY